MKWYDKFKAGLEMARKLPGIIQTVELAIPGQGKGEQKLDLVRELLLASLNIADIGVDFFEEAWPKIQKLISKIVSVFNDLGVFKKKAHDVA